jgi:CPA2 family monovalent cation:H+ antiporter-2
MILGETPLSRRATEETLPLRDAFAVLFFVSVGMLFDPRVVIEQPLPLLATVAIIVLGKSIAAFVIVRAFGYKSDTALTVAASLAQIGEFSFILATLGSSLGILPADARDLILAGAIFSIFLNPFIFTLILRKSGGQDTEPGTSPTADQIHIVLVGYGRVGRMLAASLKARGEPLIVIEDDDAKAETAQREGHEVIDGNATDKRVLQAAGIERATSLLIAIPEGFDAGAIAEKGRALKPDIRIVARAHSDAEVAHLNKLGVADVVLGERVLATKMLELAVKAPTGTETG